MSRTLVWLFGGGTLAVGAGVAAYLATGVLRETPVPVDPAPLVAVRPQSPAESTPQPAPQLLSPDAPAPQVAQGTAPTETAAPEVDAAPIPPPMFDVVRIARDGNALVAGEAAPGAALTLRVDGQVVAQTAADGAGQFVALFSLGYSEAAQMMTLEMESAEGVVIVSDDTVILTPRIAPVLIAEAETPAGELTEDELVVVPAVEIAALQSTAPTVPITPEPLASASAVLPSAPQMAEDVTPQTAPVEEVAGVVAGIATQTSPEASVGLVAEVVTEAVPDAPTDALTDAPRDDVVAGVTTETPVVTADEAGPELTSDSAVSPDAAPAPILQAALVSEAEPVQADPVEPRAQGAAETTELADTGQAVDPGDAAETLLAQVLESAQAPIQAEQMPSAFIVRGSGAVQVLDPAPRVMDNVVIDSISYSADGDVQISGRSSSAQPTSNLRIYLNNAPIAVAQAERGDWSSVLPQVEPGVYTLRVDQVSDRGHVVSRFETPFLREDPERVAVAQRQAQAQAQVQGQTDPEPVASRAVSETQPVSGALPDREVLPGSEVLPDSGGVPETATATETAAVTAPVQVAVETPVQTPVQAPVQTPVPAPPVSLITVQPGHTLWAISNARYGAGELYVVIYRANRSQIRDPDLIYPGQVFTLPEN